MSEDSPPAPAPAVLEAFDLAPEPIETARSGLINRTWFVRSRRGEKRVLQRVNSIFRPEIHDDIAAVTRHLKTKGLITPALVPTVSGALWLEHGGAVWRVLSHIEGLSRDALESPAQARAAGVALADFHRALADLEHTFQSTRLGVHDTARHLAALRAALTEHREHPEIEAVRPLAVRVLELGGQLPVIPHGPDRIVHGDPKVSNIVFAAGGERALSFVDLDTLARMPVALELGDAMRSWCNPAPEDSPDARFALELYAAATGGYADAAGGLLERVEWQAIPAATLTVTVELAARFATDSLRERYFGWDPNRYRSASAHHQARTRAQLTVAAGIVTAFKALTQTTARAFARE